MLRTLTLASIAMLLSAMPRLTVAEPELASTSITFAESGPPRSLDPHIASDLVSSHHDGIPASSFCPLERLLGSAAEPLQLQHEKYAFWTG
jgi:hypothetical protein